MRWNIVLPLYHCTATFPTQVMSLKLSTTVSLDDWGNYLRSSLQHLVKTLRQDLPELSEQISVNKCIELIQQLNERMEQTLGYCSVQATRFAPKFSRFLFFDVEKEGSLYCILS